MNQFAEVGRLLEGWRQETKHIDLNDPELPALLTLRVFRRLVSYLSANNCSTACLSQLKLLENIITTAKELVIAAKKKLYHHMGYCFNHQQDKLCNTTAIGFCR